MLALIPWVGEEKLKAEDGGASGTLAEELEELLAALVEPIQVDRPQMSIGTPMAAGRKTPVQYAPPEERPGSPGRGARQRPVLVG